MNVETLNSVRGRIAVHLICLCRSLLQGRFSSVSFFCAGIWRGLHDALKGSRHPIAIGSHISSARL